MLCTERVLAAAPSPGRSRRHSFPARRPSTDRYYERAGFTSADPSVSATPRPISATHKTSCRPFLRSRTMPRTPRSTPSCTITSSPGHKSTSSATASGSAPSRQIASRKVAMKLSARTAGIPRSTITVRTPGVRRIRCQSFIAARANRYPGKRGQSTSRQRSLQRCRSLTRGSHVARPNPAMRASTFFSARDSVQITNQEFD